jgi:alpha-tubulin suppressor-like RCC1 family protein
LSYDQHGHPERPPNGYASRYTPVEIVALGCDNAKIAAGGKHSLVLKADGRIMGFGQGIATTPVEIAALGSDNVQIAAGGSHSLVLKADGRVMAFGENKGELGIGCIGGDHDFDFEASVAWPRLRIVEIVALGCDNAKIAAGGKHSLVLKADGRVMGFGDNSKNQLSLGDGSVTKFRFDTPTEIAALGHDNAQIAAGGFHSLVLKVDGRLMGFGDNSGGQLGVGAHTFRNRQTNQQTENTLSATEIVALGYDNVKIAAGARHSLVLKEGGNLVALGHCYNSNVQSDMICRMAYSEAMNSEIQRQWVGGWGAPRVDAVALGGGNIEIAAGGHLWSTSGHSLVSTSGVFSRSA